MKCKYCGRWAGLFKNFHEECEREFEQKQAEIKQERERIVTLIKTAIKNMVEGIDDVNPINDLIQNNTNVSIISFDEIADVIYTTLVDSIDKNMAKNSSIRTFEEIKKCKSIFSRLAKPQLYENIICYLYQKSLQLSLKGILSINEAYEISHNIFQYFVDEENKGVLFDCEENAMYIWAKENISDRDLFISDEQYNALILYSEVYNQSILGIPYDDKMQTSSMLLKYACILNKLRHNEFADDYFEIEEAKNHIILGKGEKIVWVFNELADTYQSKIKRRYVGTSAGASIRLAKGLYVRTGGYEGQSVEEQSEEYLGSGSLVITTDNLFCYTTYEEGHSIRIPFEKIVSIKSTSKGFIIEQGGKQKDIRFELDIWTKEDYSFLLKVMQTDRNELGPRKNIHIPNSSNAERKIEIKDDKPQKQIKKKSSKNKDSGDLNKYPFLSSLSLSQIVLDDEIRNKCFAAVDKLYSFYEKKCYEEKFTTIISQLLPPEKEYLDLVFLRDLFQCIIAVSGKVDVSKPHGIIAIMAIGKTQGIDYSSELPFLAMTKKVFKSLQSIADHTLIAFKGCSINS